MFIATPFWGAMSREQYTSLGSARSFTIILYHGLLAKSGPESGGLCCSRHVSEIVGDSAGLAFKRGCGKAGCGTLTAVEKTAGRLEP